MIQTFRKPRTILRKTTTISGIAGATLLLSLLGPTAASAAEATDQPSSSAATSSSVEITPEALAQVSQQQISTANSGTEKFSAADLMAQVRDQIETDRVDREKKRAEEARARAEAEAKAKAKAEAEAKAKAEAEAAAKAKADAEAAAAAQAQRSTGRSSSSSPSTSSRSSTPSSSPVYTGGGSKNDWLAASGIPESDWGYVDYIVSHESGWNPNAVNASSGAGGLVQALPCGKVAGGCFDPVSNLKWADGYAKARYGSWAGAYQFWSSNHWW